MRKFQALDGAGYARRAIADDTVLGGMAVSVEIHVARRGRRRPLAEIEKRCAAVGKPRQKKSAAAEVPRRRMRHRQRETDRDRGVDRVAPRLENVDADIS